MQWHHSGDQDHCQCRRTIVDSGGTKEQHDDASLLTARRTSIDRMAHKVQRIIVKKVNKQTNIGPPTAQRMFRQQQNDRTMRYEGL
jgi:hypothetical protein